jgi:hypothetical protein
VKKDGTRFAALAMVLFWCGWMLLTGRSSATMDIQKQAKAAGIDVKSCQHCHVDKLPKKDGPHDPNDVGKWLIAEKEKRKAAAVDGAWLKDYPGKK